MSQVVGEDFITGLGFIGLEPRRIYRMRRGPKVTTVMVKGNPAVLEHSVRGRFKGLTVYGKSTQVTTTGAQLFTSSVTKKYNSGVKLTKKDSVWHLEGTNTADGVRNIRLIEPTEHFKLPADTYTLSFSKDGVFPIGINISIAKVANPDVGSEQIWTGIGNAGLNRPTKFTLDGTEEALSIFVNFPAGKYISCDLYVMLNAGNTALPWEPYTGGKPSPSPDYPQEIVSAGEDGSVTVKVTGRNILDMRNSKESAANSGVTYTRNADYSFTRTGTATEALGNVWMAGDYLVKPKADLSNVFCVLLKGVKYSIKDCVLLTVSPAGNVLAARNENFVPTQDMYITGVRNENFIVGETYNDIVYPAVYVGEKALQYEPYREQLLTIPTPNGLPGIPVTSGGNYTDEQGQQWICDEVDLERGVYVQRVKKSSISDVTWRMTNADKHEFATEALHNIANKSYRYVNGLCDMYNVVVSELERFTDKSVIFGIDGYQLFVCDSNFGTIDEIQAYFVEHPLTIMYALATPIETPLSDSDIDAYKALRTYNGTTVVEAPSGAGLSVSYGCDLLAAEKEVNDKYAGLMAEMEDLNENSKTV